MDLVRRDTELRRRMVRGDRWRRLGRWVARALAVGLIGVTVSIGAQETSAAIYLVALALTAALVFGRRDRPQPARVDDDSVDIPLGRGSTTHLVSSVTNIATGSMAFAGSRLDDQQLLPWSLAASCVVLVSLAVHEFAPQRALHVDPDAVTLGGSWSPQGWRRTWEQIHQPAPPRWSTVFDAGLPVLLDGTTPWTSHSVRTAGSAHPMWVLIEWLKHYRDHPEDRAELATRAGVDRLERIHAELYDPTVEPTWFPPPRAKTEGT